MSVMKENEVDYKVLAKNIRLTIKEFEHNTNANINDYSFQDVIDWLENFKTKEL